MNDFKWGDKIVYASPDLGSVDREFIIIYIHNILNEYIEVCNELYRFKIMEKDWHKIKRLPRFGELIEVRDNVDEWWTPRHFICMGENGKVKAGVTNPEDGNSTCIEWNEWRFIEESKEDRRESLETVKNVIRLIVENDSKILNQMAEIILAAKEKIKED